MSKKKEEVPQVTPSAAFELLGSTADEVAANLLRFGYFGYASLRKCPLALYLNDKTWRVGWGGFTVDAWGSVSYNDCQIMNPVTPAHIREFVRRFDKGEYPEIHISSLRKKKPVAA